MDHTELEALYDAEFDDLLSAATAGDELTDELY